MILSLSFPQKPASLQACGNSVRSNYCRTALFSIIKILLDAPGNSQLKGPPAHGALNLEECDVDKYNFNDCPTAPSCAESELQETAKDIKSMVNMLLKKRTGAIATANPANGWIMIALCAAAMITLSGCAGLFIGQYGYVSPDSEKVREDGGTVIMPENAPSISQGYAPQDLEKIHSETSYEHEGIDIVGKTGTPVIAPAAGVVIRSYFEPFYGSHIVIDHGKDDNGLYIRSAYFHLNKRLVKKGDHIVRGQQIGTLGSTGLLASFPHLHYEIRVGSKFDQFLFGPMNPHRFWVDGVGVVTCFNKNRQWTDKPFRTTYPVPCRGVDWQ